MTTNKGLAEITSTILIMLIVVIVVGVIVGGLMTEVSKSKEKINFDNSVKVRDQIYSGIQEVNGQPIGSSKEVSFSLSSLILDVNEEVDTIEVCSIGKEIKFYDDGITRNEDNNKYTYRDGQKLCAGFILDNIDITRSFTLNNIENTRIVLQKTEINKIQVQLDNETETDPYSDKNYIYTGE